jgi:hypothetical protein
LQGGVIRSEEDAMRHPTTTVLFLGSAALLAGGCSESPKSLPTQPNASVTATTAACDKTVASQISTSIGSIFSSAAVKGANSLFKIVQQDCSKNIATATSDMLTLVQYSIDQLRAGNIVASPADQSLVNFWDQLFTYLALPTPTSQSPAFSPLALDHVGAVGVCGPKGCNLIVGDTVAGLSLPANAVNEPHLFGIAPTSCTPVVARTNLDLVPPCYDFSVNPVAQFNVPVTVVVCQLLSTAPSVFGRSGIGHLVQGPTGVVKLTPKASNPFPNFICPDASLSEVVPANAPVFARVWHAVQRAAGRMTALLSPEPLWATHTALAGGTKSFSPFGALDPLIFQADFTNSGNVIGQPPGPPEKGTWTAVVTAPGSITVQSSLGDINAPVAVLSQAGGACTTCGGLYLIGTVRGNGPNGATSAPATVGTYQVSWRSVVSSPTVKDAPFVLRSADSLVVAQLDYLQGPSAKSGPLVYSTPTGQIQTGVTWSQNVSQTFTLTVNLDSRTTSLSINGTPVSAAQGIPFVDANATSLQRVAAEFTRIDAQTVGWTDVKVSRLADAP